jgi:PhzF family phenazine biosynthesis protein
LRGFRANRGNCTGSLWEGKQFNWLSSSWLWKGFIVSSRLKYFIIDAFTNRPFTGNPAAVVPLDRWRSDEWLQSVALEMNLSETAYLVPIADGYRLRWFTPKVEVALCGHATLASAFVLAHLGQLTAGSSVTFATQSGKLTARLAGSHIELDFPALPSQSYTPPAGLVEALGVAATYIGRSRDDYLVEVATAREVRFLNPDFRLLRSVECRGVIVTARSDQPEYDFISRFFAPAAGIDEDPVTGSAHCVLAPYWSAKLARTNLVGYQASPRGGIVRTQLVDPRVKLAGEAVLVASGELHTS